MDISRQPEEGVPHGQSSEYLYNYISSQLTIVQLYPPVGLYQLAVLTETY
jgi:hypothetical protein